MVAEYTTTNEAKRLLDVISSKVDSAIRAIEERTWGVVANVGSTFSQTLFDHYGITNCALYNSPSSSSALLGYGLIGQYQGTVLPTLNSTPLVAGAAYSGNAVLFDGATGKGTILAPAAMLSTRTIASWVRADTNDDMIWFSSGSTYLRRLSGGAVMFSFCDAGSVQRTIQTAANVLPIDGNYHLVLATHDGTNSAIYVDNALAASSALYTCRNEPSAINWSIGSLNGSSFYHHGAVGPTGFYNKVLSSTERQLLWDSRVGSYNQSAVGLGAIMHAPMDDTALGTMRALVGSNGSYSGGVTFGVAGPCPAVIADTNGSIAFDAVNRVIDQNVYVRSMVRGPSKAVTFTFLMNVATLDATNRTIMYWNGQQGTVGYHWAYIASTTQSFSFQFANGSSPIAITTSWKPLAGISYLIEAVIDYSASYFYLYANGALVYSAPTGSVPLPIDPGKTFYLGAYAGSAHYFNGNLSHFAIRAGLPTQDEVSALQASRINGTFNATLSSRQNMMQLLLNETTGTVANDTSSSIVADSNTSLLFNGTTQYAQPSASDKYRFSGKLPFAAHIVFNPTTIDGTSRRIISCENSAGGGWTIFHASGTVTARRYDNVSTANSYITLSSPAIQTGEVHDIYIAYDTTKFYFYMDGWLVGTSSVDVSIPSDTTFAIARRSAGSSLYFAGSIDEVSIYDYAPSDTASMAEALHAGVIYGTLSEDIPAYKPLSWWRFGTQAPASPEASVYLYGSTTPSVGFRITNGIIPAVGQRVRVVIDKQKDDRWIEEVIPNTTSDQFELKPDSSTINLGANGKLFPSVSVTRSGIYFGSGDVAADVSLARPSVGRLETNSQFSIASSNGLIITTGSQAIYIRTGADAAYRFYMDYSGRMTWGDGATGDTNLYRYSANVLATDDKLLVLNSNGIQVTGSLSTSYTLIAAVTGDSLARFIVTSDGKITWGSGSATQDTNLYRYAADVLKTDDALVVSGGSISVPLGYFYSYRDAASSASLVSRVTGDTLDRYWMTADGKMQWGDGANSLDTNLYRSGVSTLKTDSNMAVSGSLTITGSTTTYSDIQRNGEAWTDMTLGNSWVNYGAPYANAGYRKDAQGYVHLRGLIKSGTLGQSVFTLPTGYRPAASSIFSVATNTTSGTGRTDVGNNGNIQPHATLAANGYLSLEGIVFKAEA